MKAKFLIPMKADNDMPSPDENGKVVIEKDTTIALATIEGKHGRLRCVCLQIGRGCDRA